MKRYSFFSLYFTNFFGVINDNFLKTLASFVVIGWLADERMQSVYMGVTAAALVLPYILCSPLADRLTVLFPKRRILMLAKLAELPIVALAIGGFILHSAPMVIGAVLLMGLQSSLYSPAKYALIRDIGGPERISTGMGGMEGISFLGVLAGTVLASCAVDSAAEWVRYLALAAFAAVGLLGSLTVRADEELSRTFHSVNPWRYLKRAYRMAQRYPGMNSVIMTLSVFWFGAAMLQMGLLVYGQQVMKLDATHTGIVLCGAAIGIVAGQVTGGFVDRRYFTLGANLLTGWLAAILLAVMYFVPMGVVTFTIVLGVLAFDLGFFKLPLDAEIQKVVKGPKLNTMLSYFNQVSFLFMLAASGVYAALSWLFGPAAYLLFLAVTFAVAPVVFLFSYRKVLIFVGRRALARRYAVELQGREALERPGSLLVLPNHPAMVDPMLVFSELGDFNLHPLVDEAFFAVPVVSRVLRTLGAVKVPDLRKHRSSAGAAAARALDDVVVKALDRGENVVFYPAGHIQTVADVESIGTRQLAYNVCAKLPPSTRVIGLRTRGLWGSIWSRCGRDSSPNFALTFVRSLLLWLFIAPFMPKRRVTMVAEDLTDRLREWAKLPRQEFNHRLEAWFAP